MSAENALYESLWMVEGLCKFDFMVPLKKKGHIATVFNSLAPGICGSIFKYAIFRPLVVNAIYHSFCEPALSWMSTGFIDDTSASVQVVAWRCLAPGVVHLPMDPQNLGSIRQDDCMLWRGHLNVVWYPVLQDRKNRQFFFKFQNFQKRDKT